MLTVKDPPAATKHVALASHENRDLDVVDLALHLDEEPCVRAEHRVLAETRIPVQGQFLPLRGEVLIGTTPQPSVRDVSRLVACEKPVERDSRSASLSGDPVDLGDQV